MKKIIAVLTLGLAITVSQASLIHFDFSPPGTDKGVGLLFTNEVPAPTNSTGSGGEIAGGIVYDTDTSILHFTIGYGSAAGFSNLSGAATASHIHAPAGPGTNAAVVISLEPYRFPAANPADGGVIVGDIPVPRGLLVSNLINGFSYVNIHTATNPGGEIRGQLIAVVASNMPPSLLCPIDSQVECGSAASLVAVVSDEDGDAIEVVWAVNGVPTQTNTIAAGSPPTGATVSFNGELPLETNVVDLVVTDSTTNTTSCSTTVTVVDTTPPVIRSLKANPSAIWPPNHRMVTVDISAAVKDTCGDATWAITSISDSGGGSSLYNGNHTAMLRAVRGVTYSITITATDASGNTATKIVTVSVAN